MKEEIGVGDIVVLPTTEYHGWPRLLVEDVYPKQLSHNMTRVMALVCWFDKSLVLHRAEFPADLLLVAK